jgi:hypothetical protein
MFQEISFDSLGGVGLLEVASMFLDEPELQSASFGVGVPSLDDAAIVEKNEAVGD